MRCSVPDMAKLQLDLRENNERTWNDFFCQPDCVRERFLPLVMFPTGSVRHARCVMAPGPLHPPAGFYGCLDQDSGSDIYEPEHSAVLSLLQVSYIFLLVYTPHTLSIISLDKVIFCPEINVFFLFSYLWWKVENDSVFSSCNFKSRHVKL